MLGEEEGGSRPGIELLHWSIALTRAAHRERSQLTERIMLRSPLFCF